MPKPEPQLPIGNASLLRGISENFSFHSSPESFITSRIISFQKEHPDLVASRAIIRAKVLNRNVAIVSSRDQILQVLSNDDALYEASAAYNELMAPFFPSPNLLLKDGDQHREMRRTWEEGMASLNQKLIPLVHQQTERHFSEPSKSPIDLYESMKRLSWKILFGTFLGLESDDKLFGSMENLHEDLLRGQFSLFPVTVNTGFWHSPRKKGKEAKKKLQAQALSHFKGTNACPFAVESDAALEDIANHTVLMTSSLAVKALASLLTALLLNLYLYGGDKVQSLAKNLKCEDDHEERTRRLRSILLETERLSPPIVGVMRRSTKDNFIVTGGDQPDVRIPKGWDCWLYFVGGGRDPEAFGPSWDTFEPGRYMESSVPEGVAYGGGPKTCLGREAMRQILLAVAETCLGIDVNIQGKVLAQGVRGWLGWEPNSLVRPQDWAQDMKQLPTQRPSAPVMIQVGSG